MKMLAAMGVFSTAIGGAAYVYAHAALQLVNGVVTQLARVGLVG